MFQVQLLAFFSIFALLGLAHNEAQGAPPALTIGFDVGSPPFFDLEKGCAKGIYPLIVGAIFHDSGQSMISYPAPFSRILVRLDSGEVGAGGILKTPERMLKYDFSDPIYTEKIVVYFNKIKSDHINTIADLKGKRVGIVRGWSYGRAFDEIALSQYVALDPVNSDLTNFKKLQRGRIDALLTIEEVGSHVMSSGEFPDLTSSGLTIRSNATYIAFSKKSNHADLLLLLNKSINKLQVSGHIAALAKQYLKNSEQLPSSRAFIETPKNYAEQFNAINCTAIEGRPVP